METDKGIVCPECQADTKVVSVVGFSKMKVKNRACLKRDHAFKTVENIPARCPKCKTGKFGAKDTRPVKGGVYRVKRCNCCGFRISSMEKILSESKPKDIKPENISFGKRM